MKKPLITAHSGCEQTLQDSMDSIERAIALGADVVEMDIRRAADGTVYISHDRQYGDAVREKVTLEDVFYRIQDTDLKINCDIKESFALCDTLDLAERFHFGSDRLILSGSVSPEQLAMEPAITECASVYLNTEEALKFLYMGRMCAEQDEEHFPQLMTNAKLFVMSMGEDEHWIASMLRLIKTLRVHTINMPYAALTTPMAQAFHAEGILCSVWTVDEVEHIDRCLEMGVHNITTRALQKALDRRRLYHLKHVTCV